MVNLYSFDKKVTSTTGVTLDDGIENIDIYGRAMIRAATKVVKINNSIKKYYNINNNNFFIKIYIAMTAHFIKTFLSKRKQRCFALT